MISFGERIPPDSNMLKYLPPLPLSYNKTCTIARDIDWVETKDGTLWKPKFEMSVSNIPNSFAKD